jgi:hypothetical protein
LKNPTRPESSASALLLLHDERDDQDDCQTECGVLPDLEFHRFSPLCGVLVAYNGFCPDRKFSEELRLSFD